MRQLQNFWKLYVWPAIQDAGNRFRIGLVDETINGLPGTMPIASTGSRTVVGVQTGMLKRSFADLIEIPGGIRITSDSAIAPYNTAVNAVVISRHGKTITKITGHFHGPEIVERFRIGWKRFIKIVNAGNVYTYKNPFL